MKKSLSSDELITLLRKRLPRTTDSAGRPSLRQALTEEGLEPLLFISSEDAFRTGRFVSWLRTQFFSPDSRILSLAGSDLSSTSQFTTLARALNQTSLFGGDEMVVVSNTEKLKAAPAKDLTELLRRGTTAVVVFTAFGKPSSGKDGAKSNPLKELRALCTEVAIPALEGELRRKWIEREAQRLSGGLGGGITPDAARILSEAYGSDLGALCSELQKLLLVVPNGAPVTREVVDNYTRSASERASFELFVQIAQKNPARAVLIALELVRQGLHPLQINAFLSRAVRMTLARALERGTPKLSSELAHPWFWRQISSAERLMSVGDLRRCLEMLQELDLQLKSSTLDHELALTAAVERVAARSFPERVANAS